MMQKGGRRRLVAVGDAGQIEKGAAVSGHLHLHQYLPPEFFFFFGLNFYLFETVIN